jgi:glycine cleavage system transcriptional repressor
VAHFAVSAIGRDRPGIVAALTEVLLELDGNVEDSRMTILRGQFAVMLIVSLEEENGEELGTRLEPVREQLGLAALAVSPVAEPGSEGPATASPTHVITVYGADHPGIVHAVSSELATHGANITDLQTQLAGGEAEPLYVMLLEVELGSGGSAGELEEALREVGERAAVEVSIGEIESEAL